MVLRLLRLALFLTVCASPALACTVPTGPDSRIHKSGIDQRMLSRAILAEVNYQRCRVSLPPLSHAPEDLIRVAHGHSAWMAEAGRMSHQGGRETGRTLTDRVRRAGLRPSTYAENLAYLPRYRFGDERFQVADRSSCHFLSLEGDVIHQHSYRSLARTVVAMWMESPGHRRNLLSRNQREMSAAASLSPDAYCGRFYVTQIFTG